MHLIDRNVGNFGLETIVGTIQLLNYGLLKFANTRLGLLKVTAVGETLFNKEKPQLPGHKGDVRFSTYVSLKIFLSVRFNGANFA